MHKEIVLINPLNPLVQVSESSDHVLGKLQLPFLGILYIAAKLELEGFNVEVLDAQYFYASGIDLDKYIEESCSGVAVFGINSCITTHQEVLRLAAKIKESAPNSIIVVGGPHASLFPESVITHTDIDIVSVGEGEYSLTEICEFILLGKGNLASIKGIYYKDRSGNVCYTGQRPFITNLDVLPFPAKHLMDKTAYRDFGTIITGRGCPGRCIYCAAAPLSGSQYRWRSPENVIEEVKHCIENYDLDHIFFVDDTFTVKRDRVIAICNMIKEVTNKYNITWSCESRVNAVNPELLGTMADAGCRFIQFGMESGSNYVLKTIKKGTTVEKIEQATRWALDAGITVAGSFIIGHHSDTKESVEETIRFASKLRSINPSKVKIAFSINTPLPGTDIYNNAKDYGIKILTDDWSQYNLFSVVAETSNLSAIDIQNYYFESVLASKGVKL